MREEVENFSARSDGQVFGRRLRHYRRLAGLTLSQLGERVGRQPSYLSQLENGRREPRLSTVHELAAALGCAVNDLLELTPPDRRSSLELRVAEIQASPAYLALRLPHFRPTARVDDVALQHIVALFDRVVGLSAGAGRAGAGQGARAANAAMREEMRRRDNYYAEIEAVAEEAVRAVDPDRTMPLSERGLSELAAHFGFSIARVNDLPASSRSISDLRHRVIYVAQRNDLPARSARSVIAQTLGHFALGHRDPADFGEYVRQRVEANYFAGALLAPEHAVVALLAQARERGDISVEDLRDVFYISYEMAAHRLTNLITHHFGIPVHFERTDREGLLWKAYENDGVPLPADADGTVEGQRVCREWGTRQAFESGDTFSLHYQVTETPAGAFFCVTSIESDGGGEAAITIGTPLAYASAFRGKETDRWHRSACPDPACCRAPAGDVAQRWQGSAWPSARDRSHFVSGLPTDAVSFNPFPGVDLPDVFSFLDRHGRAR